MFEIKESDCFSVRDKLLYNILEALQTPIKPVEQPKSEPVKSNASIGKCSVCGKEWANNGQRMACAKKHKKEGKKV